MVALLAVALAATALRNTFFHVRDLDPDLAMDDTLLERRVKFEATSTEKGPRAANVRPVD